LKIEPQSVVQQQVTMFPVLARLPNPDHLLRPGMNAEIAITVGDRRQVAAVPNAALRTQRDVASAAGVLGLEMDAVQKQLADARAKADSAAGQASMGGAARVADSAGNGGQMITLPDGRQIPAPPGVDPKKVEALFAKMRSGGGAQALSDEERQLMQQVFRAGGGARRVMAGDAGGAAPGGGRTMVGGGGGAIIMFGGPGGEASTADARLARSARRQAQAGLAFGGDYIVFVMRQGQPAAVPVRTGLTDLDQSEVVSGLAEGDSVLVLPSASLVQAQQEFQNMRNRMGGIVPGMRNPSSGGGARR
ncbi:MAG: hypothetical protein HY560_09685, partial [Gemmatimonadetes bacterium]|nr:hypothetical protein [Gemmatimonadota bacterium]